MLNVFVHLFITLFLCLMYPYILLCIYVFILVRKLHPLSHLLALFFSLSPTYTKNKALKTEVYSEKATPINCYPPIATSNVLGPSGLLLSSLLTWLILAILYCNRLRLRVKRKINWNWIELNCKFNTIPNTNRPALHTMQWPRIIENKVIRPISGPGGWSKVCVTDRPTDLPTDTTSCRGAFAHLKTGKQEYK